MVRTTNSDGYVTLAVLVMLGIMAALASSLLMVSRPALGFARLGADEVIADGLLDGAIASSAFLLYLAKWDVRDVNGRTIRFEPGNVTLAVTDEASYVDLNTAEPELLEGLYKVVGGMSLDPASFAARVNDWRDDDEDVGQGGAEAGEYDSAGVGYRPANTPFRSVDELKLLLGLSREDFARLAPHVTVHSRRATIDPLSASPTVLMAVPTMTRSEVQRLVAARQAGQNREQLAPLIARHEQYLADEASGVYRVGAHARLTNGFAEAIEAVITEPRQSADYGVVAWKRLAQPPRAR
jgi:general secretion pathway protein K